ncbi:hypothetical protein DFA_01246 [Cavenderia fasciculata]|uniref:Uncharacterized protein n=1 Tax=Cavenderia fasciculata TaxID=261658 RepID=F4PRM5_CACFS|nr:uncharacterized protein DFA_01246 [Cavenderia fasciculata]EGG21365.1 hypothetical protein DFA_01246 [Cavenderia fasciculata]|eukprot:XP_004359215.1 hypothetical protein DFA_01246 [Cavenderia fasciculata]
MIRLSKCLVPNNTTRLSQLFISSSTSSRSTTNQFKASYCCSTSHHQHNHTTISSTNSIDTTTINNNNTTTLTGDRKKILSDNIKNGGVPSLNQFMKQHIDTVTGGVVDGDSLSQPLVDPFLLTANTTGDGRSVFVESYGCQMNFADTEVIYAVMKQSGYIIADSAKSADVIFLNTCAIRENAEDKIWFRLTELRKQKRVKRSQGGNMVIGVLGCMAERLKQKLLDSKNSVDLVVGPDAYRSLPALLGRIEDGQTAINVMLSADETYADIAPVRHDSNGLCAYVSIMRGCNNMCSYCIVPFTRGRERSRPLESILDEVKQLSKTGYKEITLLGQNVNSYNYIPGVDAETSSEQVEQKDNKMEKEKLQPREGFNTIYKSPKKGITFTELMDAVSLVDPEMRVRFTSPHPKDFPDSLIELVKVRPNICRQFHIPAQSGNSDVLERMRRGYTRESYIELIDLIKRELPDCSISSDFISGFCGETEQEHRDTISLMEYVGYENAYMFAYSLREKTHAHRSMKDDVTEDVKARRLKEVIDTYYKCIREKSKDELGKKHLVLVERQSRRSGDHFVGRTDSNKKCIVPMIDVTDPTNNNESTPIKLGDYVMVEIIDGSDITLQCKPLMKSSINHFNKYINQQQI